MPEHSPLRHHISQKITIALLLGVIVWVVLLFSTSTNFRTSTATHTDVSIGPLVLNGIDRTPIHGGGKQVTISFASGLLWYYAIWLVLGMGAGYLVAQYSTPDSSN